MRQDAACPRRRSAMATARWRKRRASERKAKTQSRRILIEWLRIDRAGEGVRGRGPHDEDPTAHELVAARARAGVPLVDSTESHGSSQTRV